MPQKDDHPTPKPHEMPAHFMRLHTQVGDVVLDPFMGGGSSGVAAAKMGRKFIGIELDQRWFELSVRRISEALKQPDMFIDSPRKKPGQEVMDL